MSIGVYVKCINVHVFHFIALSCFFTGYCQTSNYSTLAKMYTDNRSAGFGPEVQRRILVGSFALASRCAVIPSSFIFTLFDYLLNLVLFGVIFSPLDFRSYASYFQKAQCVRRLIADDFSRVFAQGVLVFLCICVSSF